MSGDIQSVVAPAVAGLGGGPFMLERDGRVRIHQRGAVAIIQMNRSDKRNALDLEQIDALSDSFQWLAQASTVRAAVLTGDIDAFSAGGDITMFQEIGPDQGLGFTRRGFDLLRPLETGEKTIIAAVTGYCLAGGLEIALACDFIVAGRTATFGFGEVDLGLIPGWGGTVRLARSIPVRLARQWTLTSERVSAERAAEVGLVNEVHDDDAVLERAVVLAERIAAQPPHAVRAAKMVIGDAADGSIEAALSLERSVAGALFGTSDVREKVTGWRRGGAGTSD